LLTLLLAQVGFGLILSDEDGVVTAPLNRLVDLETAELAHDVHEALFNVLLGFIILHVAAIIFYRLVRGKRLLSAMIHGEAELPAGTDRLVPASGRRLIACLVTAAAITAWIIAGSPPL
jgi:cytochrome b